MTSPSKAKNGKGAVSREAASAPVPDVTAVAESAPTSPSDALAALDDALESIAPPDVQEIADTGTDEAGDAPRKRRGRPPGSSTRKRKADPAPTEPPSPAMVDAYGAAAAGVCGIGFRIAGRVMGGAPAVWEVTDSERVDLARAFGPLLAIHHETIGGVMPYAEPVLLLYDMFATRQRIAAAQVAELRRLNGETPGVPNE